jgi:Na+/H+-dicarboxylate symporter
MQRQSDLFSSIEFLHPRSLKYLQSYLQGLTRGRLWLQVLIGMVLGVATGIALGPSTAWFLPDTAETVGNWLALPGQLFLTLIQMVVIPLVIASVIRGLAASEDVQQLRRTGLRVVFYFVVTTAVAVIIGVWLAFLIRPGDYIDSATLQATLAETPHVPSTSHGTPTLAELPEKFVTLFPKNPLDSMLNSNMLQIVMFSLIFGMALVMMPPKQAKPLLDLLGSILEVCMTIVRWAMWLAPVAVFGLLAQLTSKIGLDALLGMGVYVGTVLAGLLLMLAIYLGIVFFLTRHNPFRFLAAVREVLLLAFSTSSSAAVMPLSIKTAEEKLGVRPSISQFVIPRAATINMNGTAVYQGVAAIFLAQVFGVDIGLSGILLIVVVAVGAAIGSPGTPGVGIVILAMVLTSVGIPATGIALILGVDRILDMCRTAINVAGDLVACVVMDRWAGGKQSALEEHQQEIEREKQRAASGADVLTNHHSAPGDS